MIKKRWVAVIAFAAVAILSLIAVATYDVKWMEAFRKLADKRVDIFANALSGLAVGITLALVALGSWRLQQAWQRKISLRHQAEDAKRLGEAKRATQLEWRRGCIAKLKEERERFAERFEGEQDAIELKRAMDEFRAWLANNRLKDWRSNHTVANLDRRTTSTGVSVSMMAQMRIGPARGAEVEAGLRNQLAADARNVEIPAQDEDYFDWPSSE